MSVVAVRRARHSHNSARARSTARDSSVSIRGGGGGGGGESGSRPLSCCTAGRATVLLRRDLDAPPVAVVSPSLLQSDSPSRRESDLIFELSSFSPPRTRLADAAGSSSTIAREFRSRSLDVLAGLGWCCGRLCCRFGFTRRCAVPGLKINVPAAAALHVRQLSFRASYATPQFHHGLAVVLTTDQRWRRTLAPRLVLLNQRGGDARALATISWSDWRLK